MIKSNNKMLMMNYRDLHGNQIFLIQEKLFANLTHLKTLYVFEKIVQLFYIFPFRYLRKNRLEKIAEGAFENAHALNALYVVFI